MQNLIENLLIVAKDNKNTAAVVHEGTSYSYAELFSTAFGIRNAIKESEEHYIAVYTDNNFHTYAAILGVLLANKAFVPLNHKFPKDRLEYVVNAIGIKQVLACASSKKEASLMCSSMIELDNIEPVHDWNIEEIDANLNAYVLFTSGSTGEPKGISITLNNLGALMDNIFDSIPMEESDKVLQTFELSFDVSIACTFMAWSKGATLYLSPLEGIIAVNAFKTIVDHQVNFVCIAPSAISYLKKLRLLKEFPVPYVTATVFTGEALHDQFVKDWKACASNSQVYNAYGPTENTVWSFVHKMDSNTQVENGLVPIGFPVSGFEYRINEPINGLGELWVTGPQVFTEYWGNEKKTQEALVSFEGKIWYRTGDIVKTQSSEDLMYVNRLDSQVQINGYRVELGEVEHKVSLGLKGASSVVFLNELEEGGSHLVAVIERSEPVSIEEKKALNELLPFYMQPKTYIQMPQFPINTNGKIDRKTIKKLVDDKG